MKYEHVTIRQGSTDNKMLGAGNELRGTAEITDTSVNTVTKVLIDTGKACQKFHDEKVHTLDTLRVECDEIWSFVGMKEKNASEEDKADGMGDVWTWTAIDAESKLIISYYVGNRDVESATEFMTDLKSRLANRVQLTTDGLKTYIEAVSKTFGQKVDFAQMVKIYASDNPKGARKYAESRYSPAPMTKTEIRYISGSPKKDLISTSYVERQNLTMRMHMRRFTRLTNAFSKKLENHTYAIALHFVYYNFCKIHKTLRVTPTMESGIMEDVMSIEDLANLSKIEAPKTRGKYKISK